MVRALAYFMLMDNYGNVPIDTAYGDFSPHPNVERTKVFSFIESEVKACLPSLSTVTGVATFRTLGSSFDTLIAVYRGTSISNLTTARPQRPERNCSPPIPILTLNTVHALRWFESFTEPPYLSSPGKSDVVPPC